MAPAPASYVLRRLRPRLTDPRPGKHEPRIRLLRHGCTGLPAAGQEILHAVHAEECGDDRDEDGCGLQGADLGQERGHQDHGERRGNRESAMVALARDLAPRFHQYADRRSVEAHVAVLLRAAFAYVYLHEQHHHKIESLGSACTWPSVGRSTPASS